LTFHRTKPRDVARAIKRWLEEHGIGLDEVAGAVIGKDAKRDEGGTGIDPKQAMADEGIHFKNAKDARSEGYMAVASRINTMIELWDGSMIQSLRIVGPECPQLVSTLGILPQAPNGVDDVDKAECKRARAGQGNDHHYDECRYHVMSLPMVERVAPAVERFGGAPRKRRERPRRQDEGEMRGF